MRSVEDAARQALIELRQVVGVLKEETDANPRSRDLAGLGTVVADARSAGVTPLWVAGRPARLTRRRAGRLPHRPGVVVQRGPARAGTTVRVTLTYGPGTAVEVVVEDDGPVIDGAAVGHGLAGMAERAAFVGGAFTAAPGPDGGFHVRATIPTPEVAS